MAPRQLSHRLLDPFNEFDRLLENRVCELSHRLQIGVPNIALGEPPQAFTQVACEITAAISVDLRIHSFDFIQYTANLRRRQRRMSQIVTELIESSLEVDVVLPKRVVRVENQKLPLHPGSLYLHLRMAVQRSHAFRERGPLPLLDVAWHNAHQILQPFYFRAEPQYHLAFV